MKPATRKMRLILRMSEQVVLGWCSEHPGHDPRGLDVTITDWGPRRKSPVVAVHRAAPPSGTGWIEEMTIAEISLDEALTYAHKGLSITETIHALTGQPLPKNAVYRDKRDCWWR